MTIRNLHEALAPRSIAIIGASTRAGSVGEVLVRNVLDGGFGGQVYPVNPKYRAIGSLACFASVADLPAVPDLAVIATPPSTIPAIIADLGARGTRLAVVISAGVGDADGLRQRMLEAARPYLLRIIGPNTIGLISPRARLNASFTHLSPAMGRLGLISQSGAMVSSILDWAAASAIGFSQVFSLGDMADVDVGDALNLLAEDDKTSAILMYLESVPAPRKFMSAARAAARIKPVIAVKPGRHEAAAQAARTHTGALAGADRVVDAALRRAGIIRVADLDDLFNAAAVTARFRPMSSGRVAIVTNGGGAGVLAVDELLDQGCELARLGPETIAALNACLPTTWSHANPIDIVGDAPPERYRAAVEAVAADPDVDAVLVMNCPTALAQPSVAAEAVAAVGQGGFVAGKPLLSCWLGRQAAEPARQILEVAGIASFDTPREAAEAVSLLTRWSSLRRTIERVPDEEGQLTVDRGAVAAIMQAAAADGRRVLTEPESKSVLAAYAVPVPTLVVARSAREVAAAAGEMLKTANAVVVKLLSSKVSHKSDVGGVVLNLETPEAAASAAQQIAEHLAAHLPGTAVEGFTVQPMIKRSHARELIAGIGNDPIFGPTIVFGAGGTAVEVIDDVAVGLAPIDEVLGEDLIARTRISRLLAAYRDVPAANRTAIVRVLLGLSQLVVDHPGIVSVDINPLVADAEGVIALDARVEIDPAMVRHTGTNSRLVIRPYPSELSTTLAVEGRSFVVRPIRPTDATLYPAFLARVTAEDMRWRFLTPLRALSPETLVRLTQLDYDRDLAFIALDPDSGELAAIARYAADPDHEVAEFGVLVRSDIQGHGLGFALMQHLIAAARAEGLRFLDGVVLADNSRMRQMCDELGFAVTPDPSDLRLVRVRLALS